MLEPGMIQTGKTILICYICIQSKTLRKALKIKASTLLLAWVVIFAHSIIPHNHNYENYSACTENTHGITSNPSDSGKTIKFENEHFELSACNFSNILFHTFSPDAFLACSFRNINFNPANVATKIFQDIDQFYISDHLKSTVLLRAPPAV